MKLTNILILIAISLSVVIIIISTGDASTYVTFKEALELRNKGKNDDVHVVGKLVRDENAKIVGMEYYPMRDPNFFSFQMVDTNKTVMRVIYNKPKPADFEKSEQIVVIGHIKDSTTFVAKDILLKCPSKYVEKEL
jgi:cytochrome c-type biogenesis protein CcmE